METYFVNVVEDLILTALLVGVVYAYARDSKGVLGTRVVLVGIIVGIVASLAMAITKQNTSLIATGTWNMGIFIASLVVALVALICAILNVFARRKHHGGKSAGDEGADGKKGKAKASGKTAANLIDAAEVAANKDVDESSFSRVLSFIVLGCFTLFMALRIFYMLPDVINYPANFGIAADNLVSTDFAYRIIGWLGGIVLVCIAAVAASKAFKALNHRMMGLATGGVIAVICLVQTVSLLQIFIARRIIPAGTDLYRTMFKITSWTSNNTILFTLIILAIFVVLCIFVIILSKRDKEPYNNPAQHRKNKAKWRNRRRWAVCILVAILISIGTITALKAHATAGPQLSPSEECEVRDGYVYVSLDQVEDGHLHRFTYETEAGITLPNGKQSTGGVGVRFIIIKKPNSSAYGIGLDACEICGQTGYYERDGQVVCKLCDVVMNIHTIGFKGGCNPIPFEYTVSDGYIVIEADELTQYEKTFK